MRFDDCRTEWRINDIERKVDRKADEYEVSQARRDVDSLERTVRELSSMVDGLRHELEACQDQVNQLLNK